MPRDYYTVKGAGRDPMIRFTSYVESTQRMGDLEYTRGLTQRLTPTGVCHCGNSGLLFPELGPREDGKGLKLIGWHCLVCRCTEHTPASHALWTDKQRSGKDTSSASTPMPGCGRRCSRGETDILAGSKFPTFREWVRINGQKALRKAARS